MSNLLTARPKFVFVYICRQIFCFGIKTVFYHSKIVKNIIFFKTNVFVMTNLCKLNIFEIFSVNMWINWYNYEPMTS